MVSEESIASNLRLSRTDHLLQSLDGLESELALLRESIVNLRLQNWEVHQELGVLSGAISTLNERLDTISIPGEDNESQTTTPVEAQPVADEEEVNEDPNRPLRIGDQVQLTSRQHFGTIGVVHSFTNQIVRIQVEGRRRLLIRLANNLQRIV